MLYIQVDHLEDADIYLVHTKESEQKLDLLLGTQGWRRLSESSLVVVLGSCTLMS